jgi:cupin 2 domain-containing protein
MTVQAGNLFGDVSAASAGKEAFSEIFARPGLKIERIISQGQASPPGFWYDQVWNEWVTVLKGSATLQFEDEPARRALGEGDYVLIPAGKTPPRRVDGPPRANGLARRPFRVRAYRDWINARHSGLNIHGICTPIR